MQYQKLSTHKRHILCVRYGAVSSKYLHSGIIIITALHCEQLSELLSSRVSGGERGRGKKKLLPTSTTPYPHYVLALAREIQESSLATDQSKSLATEEESEFPACVNVYIILEFIQQLKFHAANGFMGMLIHAGSMCAHIVNFFTMTCTHINMYVHYV